jgi:hypothetical protein
MTTKMADNKRGASKGKEKECKATTTAGDGWKPIKCSEADLQALVNGGLLQSQEVV